MDIILRAPDDATINAGFQALGAWRAAQTLPDGTTIPACPITQGVQKDGQQFFVLVWGQLSVPKRSPDGWTSAQSTDALGNPVTTWTPNGPVMTQANAMGGTSPVMQPYGTDWYVVLRWLGDNPPAWPAGITVVDRNTLNPDVIAALPAIA